MDIKKLVLISIAAVVLVVTALSFLILRNTAKETLIPERIDKAELIYERAGEFLASGQEDKATNAFLIAVSRYPDSKYTENCLRELASIYSKKGDYGKAIYYYDRLLKDFPDIEDASRIRSAVEDLRMKEMASSVITEDSVEYEVQPGDSLYAIARKFNTTVGLLKKTNGLKSDMIRVGQKLKITVARFSILVDKSRNILILKKDGHPFKTYTVATGKDNSTPVGRFTIVDKMVKPIWTKPGVGIVMPDSEEYELGERWIPISAPGYGIHGTNDESSIGSQSTAGCIRMLNADVIELYDIVPKGTEVEIVNSMEDPTRSAGTAE